ncbi:amidohydrolase [Photorhabdus luminescens]|uniref:Amidohydrolase 3 domain-containing protein n=1 Tax=Photorhabdus luminescens subsp. mexicana TaxID=2100167 RepID=A0A4R4JKN7_PHOLU|nr:amidohydrolase [Photorhabdus luminescens]TDB54342.1 hypothetical protein C5468_04015 [Photorhabdus luminescens subsp. mexicana]
MCQACVGKLLGTISALHLSKPQRPIDKEISETSATEASTMMPWPPPDKKADIIFHADLKGGSRIITMDGSYNLYEALAIADGKILAVGTFHDIEKFQSYKTRMVYLEGGRTLLPGFIDPHQHTLTGSVIKRFFVDCGYNDERKTKEEVLNFIQEKANNVQKNDWLLFSIYDNLRQGGDLTMSELDSCAPDNPVFVYYINMHTATANQKAFDTANINKDPKYYDNNNIFTDGSHFGTEGDPGSKKYNGMIYEEEAIELFIGPALKGQLTEFRVKEAIIEWLDENAKLGNTTIHEAGVVVPPNITLPDLLREYAEVVEGGNCRASVSLMYADCMQSDELDCLSKKYGVGSAAMQKLDAAMTLYGMKIVGDGSNQAKTAAQTEPYLNSVHFGKTNYHKGRLISMVDNIATYGWPVLIHCNGDKTLDDALEAIQLGYSAHPSNGINRIEHCTITRPDQLDTMKNLGVQPSFLMNHVYYYGYAYQNDLFGLERANRMDPTQECVDKGIPFSLHTDAPCSNIGPLQLIHTAVNRKCDVNGSPVIGPEQRIHLTEALRAVTINAAAHIGRAEQIGSLEVGKFADLVILEKNPYEVDYDKLIKIKVCETWIGGKKTQPHSTCCTKKPVIF